RLVATGNPCAVTLRRGARCMSVDSSPTTEAGQFLPPDDPIQLLDDDGRLHDVAGYPLDLKEEDFRNLYRYMVLSRRVDKQAINLQRQGQLGVYASLLGQEAAQIGGAYALEQQDWVFPSYREMGAALVRGVDPG